MRPIAHLRSSLSFGSCLSVLLKKSARGPEAHSRPWSSPTMQLLKWLARGVLAVGALTGVLSQGQNAGTPSFGAQKSFGIDTIDLVSLTPEIKVPIYSKPGPLGIHPTFQIQPQCELVPYYNGSIYEIAVICNSLGDMWVNDDIYTFYASVTTQGTCTYFYNFRIGSPDGLFYSMRQLPGTVFEEPSCGATTETVVATDDSGIQVYLSASASTGLLSFTVYDGSGRIYNSGTITGGNGGVQPTSFKDAYGNAQSWSTSTYTDEYGVQSPTFVSGGMSWLDAYTSSQEITYNVGSSAPLLTAFTGTCVEVQESTDITPLTGINFPDGSTFNLSWETQAGYLTGRINGYTRREGGTVSYVYGDPVCNGTGTSPKTTSGYLVPSTLTRTDADGTWSFSVNWGSSNNNIETTTVLDPGNNKTVYTFTGYILGDSTLPILTEMQTYQNTGTVSSPAYSLLKTVLYCYNGNTSNCSTSIYGEGVAINERDTYITLGSMATSSRVQELYDAYGNTTSTAKYDFGATSPTFTITTTYGTWNGSSCVAIGNYIQNRPCDIKSYNGTSSGTLLSETRDTYDTHGGLTQSQQWTGTGWVSTSYTRNANGTIATKTPPYGNSTTYGYAATGSGGCNDLLVTSTITGSLSTSQAWSCTAALVLTQTDENSQVTTNTYNDPFLRLTSVTDPLGNETSTQYTSVTETTVTPPGGYGSVVTTLDGLGRVIDKQIQQGAGSSSYNTQSLQRYFAGNTWEELAITPCSTTLGAQCPGAGVAELYKVYDMLRRTTNDVDALHAGYTTTTYTNQDTVSVLNPAPSGENTKTIQQEVNGVGQITSTCRILSTGGTSCGQAVGGLGIVDTYTYSYGAGSTTTTVTRGSESKTSVVDGAGRTTSFTTPERGTIISAYDSATRPCGTAYSGDLVETGVGVSKECISYDAYNRVIQESYYVGEKPVAAQHCSYFVFGDTSPTVPSGSGITYSYGNNRAVNAYTSESCGGRSSLTTDEWFSYDKDGRMTDLWESTPHSGTYWHTTVGYNAQGTVTSLSGIPGYSAFAFPVNTMGMVDGLRYNGTSETSNAQFNAAGKVLSLTIGASDTETFTYDNDERMTKWVYTVGSASQTGNIYYNSNGTINEVAITDGLNSGGTQTCYYNPSFASGTGYDDIGRLIGVSCGSIWAQTYSYDIYDNITESGSVSWACASCYNAKNQYTTALASSVSYDATGDVTNDGNNAYTWYPDHELASKVSSGSTATCGSAGECAWYDAYGRLVERSSGSSYSELLLSPIGRVAEMAGATTTSDVLIPTVGGTFLFNTSGTPQFYFSDWVGSSRVTDTISTSGAGSATGDRAFSPYGYVYDAVSGATSLLEFAGTSEEFMPADTDFFITPNRDYPAVEARWLSPDPANSSWNAYAYVTNPMTSTDPSGLGQGATAPTIEVGCTDGILKDCNMQQPAPLGDQLLWSTILSAPGADSWGFLSASSTVAPTTASTAPESQNVTGSTPAIAAQNTVLDGLNRITQGINDFVKTYINEIDSNIPFSGVSSPSASNGTEKAAVGLGFLAGFAAGDGEGAAGSRAGELANAMGKTKGFVTIAVTETKEGLNIISSSENALRPAVRALLGSGEVAATGAGHAEVTGVNAAKQMGLTPTGVAASRGICPSCAQFLRDAGVAALSALKAVPF
jgi:RHS repeat-associated protein